MNQASNGSSSVWNVPNRISASRLILAVGVFIALELNFFVVSLILFLLAAGTDWIDGWYARKYDQVTKLGRVLDPFCDKILVCGVYILLSAKMGQADPEFPWWARVSGMIAIIIVGRELLVTVLRSMIEGSGGDFSANLSGKLKMWFQCIAISASLLTLIFVANAQGGELTNSAPDQPVAAGEIGGHVPAWIWWTMVVFIWLSVLSTLQSGWIYVRSASGYLKQN